MRLIDADALRASVLKWLPPDPCGQEEKEYPFETDICVSMLQEIEEAPTIEPEYNMDEWCTDCKEYDQERHCCPKYNRVIRDAVDEVKNNRWIPWDSGRFPDDSGTYIVTAYDGAKERVTFAMYQKRLKRWELTGARAYWRVLAWMPLPDPWKGDIE